MKILFVDIDTLRPDHMSCYGYGRNTTPNIDNIAKDGIKFSRYYCSDAPCLPSRASLITGQFGIHSGITGHGGSCADMPVYGADRDFKSPMDQNNFNNIFRKAGLKTVSISTFPERHSSWWFAAGFNETYNVGDSGGEVGNKVLDVAQDWLERNKGKDDWFLHFHIWDPHTPYRAPEEFGNPFENDELDTWITQDILDEHLKLAGPHGANEIQMYHDREDPKLPRQPGRVDTMKDIKRLFDGYDCGIRYADYIVGQIIDQLKEQGIYEETAIIVTSDHGENMGELGIYAEHGTADDITCNIPMIVKWPGCMQNATDDEFHYSLDLLPTMADMLDVEKWDKWDGQSYINTLKTGEKQGREFLILSQMAHVCQRSVRFGDYLYMRTLHDGFHLFPSEMLYNIKEDEHEQFDIKDEKPEICAKAAKYILDWQYEMMATSKSTVDPIWTVIREGGPLHAKGFLDGYIERLKNTNRADKAELLEAKKSKYYY